MWCKRFGLGLIGFTVMLMLSGCGQTGALYLSRHGTSQASAANDQALP